MSSDGPRAVPRCDQRDPTRHARDRVTPQRTPRCTGRPGSAAAHGAPYQRPCRSWHARIALTSAAHRARASTDASSTPHVVSRASSSSIWHDLARSWGSRPVEAQPSSRVPHGPRPEHLRRPRIFLSPSRRLRTFHLPVAPTRANVDGRRLPAAATTRRNRVHDPARDRLDHYPRRRTRNGAAAAHVRSPGADPGRSHRRLPPGLPGPAVPVPEHRPRPDRPSRRVLRPRRTGRRVDHLSDSPVSTRPARRRGGHRHHQPRDLGAPPHVHPRCSLGLARHRARLPRPPPREPPPARASSSTPNTSPSAPICPPRGRTSSTSLTTRAGGNRRSSASPGRRSTRPAASSGSRPRARRRWWDGCSRSRRPSPRP